jgi:cbb3-type cytochrome oxidase subunit 3
VRKHLYPSKQYSQNTPTFCSLTIALLSYSAQQKKAIARARQGKIKERQELEKEEREGKQQESVLLSDPRSNHINLLASVSSSEDKRAREVNQRILFL